MKAESRIGFLISKSERLLVSKYADQSSQVRIRAQESGILSRYIARRKSDFTSGMITDCYVVFKGEAVRVNSKYQTRREIEGKLERLKP